MVLTINMLIKYRHEPNNIERIIWIDEKYDSCFLINIFDNTLPKIKKIQDIEDGLAIGDVVILEDDIFNLIIGEEEISEKAKTLRNEAWEIINQLLSHGVINLLNSKTRSKIVKKVSEDLNVNSKKVNRCLKRYWKRGMHVNALLPDFQNCGGIGVQKISSDIKRGRPRKISGVIGEGVNIDQDIKGKFQLGIAKFYLRQNNVSVRYAFEQTIKEYFRDVLKDTPDKLPTYNQFLYWLRKNENLSNRLIKRHGKRNYELKHRPVLGSVQQEVRSPGQKALIDSTTSDVYLCNEFDHSIIGRGTVYFVKDIFSRMILSVHVCLEGPNFEQARIALMNMVENKVDFCKRFGVEIQESEWPTAHLPECIVADRAELLSHASTLLTERLNIKIENSAPFRGDFKSLVEQQFAILNRQVKPILPGAVQSDFKVRGAKDYRLSSVLTLKDLTKIVILCAIHYNNNFVIENYIRDEEMIKDGISPIPVKLFEWGMKNRAGKLRTISKEQLMLTLLPSAHASITEFGIKWNNMYFTNETALREQWFVESRFSGRKKVTITYDPRDVGIIYLHNKDKHSFERCFLLEHQSRYKEKTLDDVNFLQQMEMQNKQQHKKSGLKEKINLMEQVEEIVKDAEKKSKKDRTNISKNQRLKSIKENRKQEIERVRKETVQVDHAPLIKKQVHEELNEAEKVIDFPDDLQLLRKFQQKGLGNKNE